MRNGVLELIGFALNVAIIVVLSWSFWPYIQHLHIVWK